MAIGAMNASDPGSMLLALNGSRDRVSTSASPTTGSWWRANRTEWSRRPIATCGSTVRRAARSWSSTPISPASLDGIRRVRYDGAEIPVAADEVVTAEVTTRDIDRGDAPHFLLKEIGEAPDELPQDAALQDRRTRGRHAARLASANARSRPRSRSRLAAGVDHADPCDRSGHRRRRRPEHRGVADRAVRRSARRRMRSRRPSSPVFISGSTCSDTLAIAVSQSGTTTDTNRTVDLLRARGAAVIGIVNRRASDLVDKADGILYTSDGRDRRDERRLDEGVLLPGGRRGSARLCDHRGQPVWATAARRHELLDRVCGRSPTRCRR